MSLSERLDKIKKLEDELIAKATDHMLAGVSFGHSELFVMGALKRVLALADGFRTLLSDKNFTCCAGLLRMQLDTAARINALKLVENMDVFCEKVMSGERFDKLRDRDGNMLKDFYLTAQRANDFPWVKNVYKQTSGFVHLSERHLFASIAKTDEAERIVYFSLGAEDPQRPDETYYEIIDAFFEATKAASLNILAYLWHRKTMREDCAKPSV